MTAGNKRHTWPFEALTVQISRHPGKLIPLRYLMEEHPPSNPKPFIDFLSIELRPQVDTLWKQVDALVSLATVHGASIPLEDLLKMKTAAKRLSDYLVDLADNPITQMMRGSAMSTLRHDLRTPVASIIGYGELVAEEAEGDSWLDAPLHQALDTARRLLEMFSSIDQMPEHNPVPAHSGNPEGGRLKAPASSKQNYAAATGRHRVVGRILVVDDNESIREVISRRLLQAGHMVDTCGSGEAALSMTGDGGFDLMLLDLMMPGLTGLDVLRAMEARPGGRAIPVIVVSASDQVEAAVQCIDAGADDFLSKPLDETLLRARITSSLERKFLRDREQTVLEQLKAEQARSEMLLRNVLPADIVERLRVGEKVIADKFDEATVMFCDLVGFTAMSAALEPEQTLTVLNDIFSGFDELAAQFQLEKIKTIGDAYMLVGGISAPMANHAQRVVAMAAGLADIVGTVSGSFKLGLRIGIDTGPVVAGIIGRQKFFYDVWGDTVNTANRLEETCQPGRVHVSAATRLSVGKGFRFEARPPIEIRGKGTMQTYLLGLD